MKYFIIFILTFVVFQAAGKAFSNPHISFSISEQALSTHSEEIYSESAFKANKKIPKTAVSGWKTSLNSFLFTINHVKNQALRRISKGFTLNFYASLCRWQVQSGISTTHKILFLIYAANLSRTLIDPDIHILSSRAHPPTIL